MQALDELVERDLILLVRQFGQLLHSAVGFVALEHDRVEHLRHDEKVVDLLSQDVLSRKVIQDFELARVLVAAMCARAFSLSSGLEELQLRVALVLDLLQLGEQESLLLRRRC